VNHIPIIWACAHRLERRSTYLSGESRIFPFVILSIVLDILEPQDFVLYAYPT